MDAYLRQVAEDLRAGKRRRATVRTILREAGFRRRGVEVVKFVRQKLKKHGLRTTPDFADADLDSQVNFEPVTGAKPPKVSPSPGTDVPSAELIVGSVALKSLSSHDKELTWRSGYRMLFRDFPTYVEALRQLQADGRVTVTGKGQNRFKDKDAFSFFVAIDRRYLGKDLTAREHQYLVDLLNRLQEEPEVKVAEEPLEFPRPDLGDIESRLAIRLGEVVGSLRETFESSLDILRVDMERKVEELRHDSIRQVAAVQNTEEFGKLIEEEHSRHMAALQGKEEQVLTLEEEVIRLSAQLEELEADLTQGLTSFDPADAFSTMESTVRLFAEISSRSPVQVLPSAIDAARRSSCKRRLEVLQLLLVLRDLADALYVRGESPGPLKDWFIARSYEYAPKDSETTTSKFGAEREWLINGEKLRFEEHVTLFPNTPECTQVYFHRDGTNRCLLIGYVGQHLRISSR